MEPGKLGILAYVDTLSGAECVDFAHTVERLGYSTLWLPETFGRDPFVMATYMLDATRRIAVGTAIANVWKREPMATMAAARNLAELFDDRFILGLGVSAGPFMRRNGLRFEKPVEFVRDYLARMKSAPYKAPLPKAEPPVVLAGLRPQMLRLAAEASHGVITALTPPSLVAKMRTILGPDRWILAQQMVMLETDPAKARTAIRNFMRFYMSAPPYRRHFTDLGFNDDDMKGGGSDRLLDSVIAWGDETVLRQRILAHRNAGADHVYLIPLSADGGRLPEMRVIEALAPK
ncbi:MAG TPA: TIGR03620 family F420-dependent LLM class oxidoreductase [Candidatus Binataceae bacterium]|nr:TIGR03620 family F420-dependent LLM class oxidoreductase [Candidatus Binataceae bacterium]